MYNVLSLIAQATTTIPAAATAAGAATPAPAPAPLPGLPPDLILPMVLLGFVLILITARLVGGLFVKLGQPRVVGEIVAGVLLGPSLLGPAIYQWTKPWGFLNCNKSITWPGSGTRQSITGCFFPAQSRSVLGVIGQIALLLFMFAVGTQLDFTALKGRLRGVFTVGIGVVIIPLLLGFAVGPVLYGDKFTGKWGTPDQPSKLAFSLMIGAMLSVTAFPVAARILQEKKLDQSQMGVITIAAAAVVTILMFLLVGVANGVAKDQPASSHVKRLIGTVALIVVATFIVRPLLANVWGRLGSGGERLAVASIVALAGAYAADRIGINVIVGGFIAGCAMPRMADLSGVVDKLNDFTVTALLPVFLAVSGLITDFTKLTASMIGGLALFIVAGIVGKWGGGFLAAKLGGLSTAEGNVLGVLMNCRGLLVLVAALIAFQSNVISAPMQVGGVLMALITTGMTGPLVDKFLPAVTKQQEAEAAAR